LPRAAAAALAFLTALTPGAAADPAYDLAARTILCDCGCPPQSVHDCACARAAEMREEMAAAVASGATGQQVVDDYVARYGERILIAPAASGFNLLAWIGPGLALPAGIAVTILILRRWRREEASRVAPAEAPLEAGDEAYVARLQERLREYE
jgi:cytochrome c-type biogenesis protein CcmH/NrfF